MPTSAAIRPSNKDARNESNDVKPPIKEHSTIDYNNQGAYGNDFFTDTNPDEQYQFNKTDLEKKESFYIFAHIHTLARKVFELEIQHVANASNEAQCGDSDDSGEQLQANRKPEDYVRRPSMDQQYCGNCKTSTVGGYWMCCTCGEDLCTECRETLCETTICTKKRQHKKEQFVPCGKFHLSTLRHHFEALEQKAKLIPKYLHDRLEGRFTFTTLKPMTGKVKMEYRKCIKVDVEQFTREQFQRCWSHGDVVVVSGLQNRFRKDWSPRRLKVLQGDALVTACNIKLQTYKTITLEEYFDLHFGSKTEGHAYKLQEWPSEPFKDVLRPLFDDLLQALPLPEYTRPDGVFNLSRYFPMHQVHTDLSPKLHASKGLGTRIKSYGSIPISSELSDAIYICVHTENSEVEDSDAKEESRGPSSAPSKDTFAAVIWDIYREEDRHLVKEFLKKFIMAPIKANPNRDPWTCNKYYLSPEQQLQLYQETGVQSYQVLQRKGEAVMIPAGYLRQARYIHDSILVGVDFVSPERFSSTWRWHEEGRILNLKRKNRRQLDVLMAKDILFYSTLAML
ncbi:hypothetical protein BGZ58_006918 [Dissophora ornata]|nr:hypothetical protein BGZ58_006918 [Dissophora ornata]